MRGSFLVSWLQQITCIHVEGALIRVLRICQKTPLFILLVGQCFSVNIYIYMFCAIIQIDLCTNWQWTKLRLAMSCLYMLFSTELYNYLRWSFSVSAELCLRSPIGSYMAMSQEIVPQSALVNAFSLLQWVLPLLK